MPSDTNNATDVFVADLFKFFAPENLTATPAAATQINLAWTDRLNDETQFRIERSPDGTSGWTQVGTAAANGTTFNNTGLMASTVYFYRVRAYRAADDIVSNPSNVATEKTAPATPTSLSVTAVVDNALDLTWADNSPDETEFRIEHFQGGNFVEIATVEANVTSYRHSSLGCETTHQYRVRAFRAGDATYIAQFSAYSNTGQQITSYCPLIAPTNLSVTGTFETAVGLQWTDNASTETGFRIERSLDGVEWTLSHSVGPNVTSTQATGLQCATLYHFRVQAVRTDAGQLSAYTNTVQATTTVCVPPLAPTNLAVTGVGELSIGLSWTDNANNETDFKIEHSRDGANWQEVGSVPANTTSFSDTLVRCNTLYHLRVRAFRSDIGFYSAYTNSVQATTGTCTQPGPITQVGPAGNITSRTPRFTWTEASITQWYHLLVQTTGGATVFDQWLQTGVAASCVNEVCSYSVPTPLGSLLGETTLQWSIQPYGGLYGLGPTTGPQAFAITVPALTAPVNSVDDPQGNPTYQWNAIPDATWYQIYLLGPGGLVFDQWFSAVGVCSAGVCSSKANTPLGSGAHQAWMQAYSPTGYGAWGGPYGFTIAASPPPQITKLAPFPGSILSNATVDFTWLPDSSVRKYELYVAGPNGWSDFHSWDPATYCTATLCSVTIILPRNGAYTWYLHGVNAAGGGPWGPTAGNYGAVTFTLNVPVPGVIVKNNPINNLVVPGGQVVFSWQHDPLAVAYDLYVSGPGGWYDYQLWNAATHCSSGTCSATIFLPTNGPYGWYLRGKGPTEFGDWGPPPTYGVANFSVNGTLPGVVTKLSPAQDATLTNSAVTLTWQETADATSYEVYLGGPGGWSHYAEHIPGTSAACAAGTCQTTLYVPNNGLYSWYMRAKSPAGFGEWGPAPAYGLRTFTVTAPAPPATAPLVTPADGATLAMGTPPVLFLWNATANTTWYRLVIENRGTGVVAEYWYSAKALGCEAPSSPCTTTRNLNTGSYRWTVQTWGPGSTTAPVYVPGVTPAFSFVKLGL